jgi:hypothetical protein
MAEGGALQVETEWRTPDGLFSTDMLLRRQRSVDGRRAVVEVDGPHHFTHNTQVGVRVPSIFPWTQPCHLPCLHECIHCAAYERRQRKSTTVRSFPPPSLDVRPRNEFPQYQTYQCYVPPAVVDALGFLRGVAGGEWARVRRGSMAEGERVRA